MVEPPSAVTTAIAFSNALRVMMSRGRSCFSIIPATILPAARQSSVFLPETAFCAELPGGLMPIASIAEAIVLAVYMPPHEPGPGMAQDSIVRNSASSISPRACAPTASKTLMMSTFLAAFLPPMRPGMMVPPYTKTAGRLRRAIAIMHAGMFLSQPPIVIRPSKPSHALTASIESAIISRDTSEYFIPSVPMEMPSETVIVLNTTALQPWRSTPAAASSASLLMCTLHGVTSLQVEAMPTWGL